MGTAESGPPGSTTCTSTCDARVNALLSGDTAHRRELLCQSVKSTSSAAGLRPNGRAGDGIQLPRAACIQASASVLSRASSSASAGSSAAEKISAIRRFVACSISA